MYQGLKNQVKAMDTLEERMAIAPNQNNLTILNQYITQLAIRILSGGCRGRTAHNLREIPQMPLRTQVIYLWA